MDMVVPSRTDLISYKLSGERLTKILGEDEIAGHARIVVYFLQDALLRLSETFRPPLLWYSTLLADYDASVLTM